jgi:MFS family permease
VCSAIAIVGLAVGLIAGGLLVTYASWRWVMFVNVPIGLVVAALATRVLPATGLGLVFVPTSLVILNKVTTGDAGAASSLVNVGQQVGGSIGLAVLGTVAWSAVAGSLRARAAALQTQIHHHALAAGFSRGFLVSAGIIALILIISLAVIRVRRQDLAGADPTSEPAGDVTSPSRA